MLYWCTGYGLSGGTMTRTGFYGSLCKVTSTFHDEDCMAAYVRLLREQPEFAKLWLAQVVSLLGDWFNVIALSALVSEYTGGSGLAVSGLLIARFLPPLLISPTAGVLVDRFDRKRLLMLSDALRAVIVLALLLVRGPEMLWLIYLTTVLQFCLSALFEPARAAIMPSLVAPEQLLEANTLSNVTWSVMLAVGAIIGGVVATFFGTQTALLLDAATFAMSDWFIGRNQVPASAEPIATPEAKTGGSGSFREGVRYAARNPGVAAVLFVKLGLSLGNVDSVMIAYATSLFVIGENGTGSLGILYSAFGLGSILGPLILNRFNDESARTMRRLLIVSFALVTVGWFLFGSAPTLLIASLALLVRAAGGSVTWTYSSTILQISTANEYLGRIFSLDWAGFYLATTISTLITGVLIDTLGAENVRWIVIGSGVISIIPLALWTLTVSWLERSKQEMATVVGD